MASSKLQVGNVEIFDLTDVTGPFPPSLSQIFPAVAAHHWEPHRQRFPAAFAGEERLVAHFGGFPVRSRGRTILVDTGLGLSPPAEVFGDLKGRQLPEELAANGVAPEDVDTVFITHVHPDHVGWNLTAEGALFFPRARYLMHQADWDALPGFRDAMGSYVDQSITPLQALGALELLARETSLTEEIVALPAPGHTPGHMVLLVTSGGEKALIAGDMVIHPAQVSEPDWVFSFDSDGEAAVATRKQLLDRVEAEGMTMMQCHFPSPGYGRIVRLEGRRFWQAL